MNTPESKFRYIADLATTYTQYASHPHELFAAVSEIPQQTLKEIYNDYVGVDAHFQPVNLLRAEIARLLINRARLDQDLIDILKEKIRSKDTEYFKHLTETYQDEFRQYEIRDRDMFANWKLPWRVLHTFLYRGEVKDNTRLYLEQLCEQLLVDLDLQEYTLHWVDFYGASNFGDTTCWLALFPMHKTNHREAYQFFVWFKLESVAGRVAGHNLRVKQEDQLTLVGSYDQAVSALENVKPDILQLNNKLINYFKFAPGPGAAQWPAFYSDGMAAIDFSDTSVGDLNQYISPADLNVAAGLPTDSDSNVTYNMWLFKTARVGDVVFATKGVNTCVGIGIIDGPYFFDESAHPYRHRRKVKWITDRVYQYKSGSLKNYKTLFRPDTFSPTLVWQFVLSEYLKNFPDLRTIFEKHGLPVPEIVATTVPPTVPPDRPPVPEEPTVPGVDDPLPPDPLQPLQFWWLNANPEVWKMETYVEGQKQSYTTYNERGNKRRIYKYFEEVKPGDLLIGYETSPTKQVKALYEITRGIHQKDGREEIEFQLIEKFDVPVSWNELKNNPLLKDCEVLLNNQGSLFRLSEDEFDIIREIIDNKNIIAEKTGSPGVALKYDFLQDPDKPFIKEEEFLRIVERLRRKKNIILQGPPGVGKTFIAKKVAYQLMGEVNPSNIEMVQFHQSFSYEDFIQGIRPNVKGQFDVKEGIFYSFCQRALAHPEKSFFFIIDEINRGNLSKIFGELMMLIEADKRSEEWKIKLTYAEAHEDRFFIPPNLYMIGMMNTADRSLALVDYALRRRFSFVNLYPDFGERFTSLMKEKGMSDSMLEHIVQSIGKVNKQIATDVNLGNGLQIGHSYFCSFDNTMDEMRWWDDIVSFDLQPLLEEIWFDDQEKVTDQLKVLKKIT